MGATKSTILCSSGAAVQSHERLVPLGSLKLGTLEKFPFDPPGDVALVYPESEKNEAPLASVSVGDTLKDVLGLNVPMGLIGETISSMEGINGERDGETCWDV